MMAVPVFVGITESGLWLIEFFIFIKRIIQIARMLLPDQWLRPQGCRMPDFHIGTYNFSFLVMTYLYPAKTVLFTIGQSSLIKL